MALLVAGGLVVVGANVALWVRGVVLDRESFVTALRPLADDEELLDGLTVELTDRVLALQPASRRDDDELRSTVDDALGVVLAGPLFETMWTDAARLVHDQLVRLVRAGGHQVELDLGAVLTRTDDLLEGQGHDLLDADQIERIDDVVVTRSHGVARAVDAIHLVERLALVLPVVALGMFAGVVLLARRQAFAVALVGAALAVAAVATLAATVVARGMALGRVDTGARRSAAGDVWDGLLDPLRHQTLALLVAGLVLAAGAGTLARIVGRSPLDEAL